MVGILIFISNFLFRNSLSLFQKYVNKLKKNNVRK